MKFIPLLFLIISLLLQSSVLSLPLVLLVIIVITVVYKNYFVFVLAFIFGILLDILSFKTIGFSPVFFSIIIFLILMYERKFEIQTNYFVIFSSALGSFLFIIFYGYGNLILGTIVSVGIGVLMFRVFRTGIIDKMVE